MCVVCVVVCVCVSFVVCLCVFRFIVPGTSTRSIYIFFFIGILLAIRHFIRHFF